MLRSGNDQHQTQQPAWLWIPGLCWVAVILAAGVLPLSNFVGHSHWDLLLERRMPDLLSSPWLALEVFADVVLNILLFVPLGWIWVQHFSHKGQRPRLLAVAIGFVLSLGIELYQLYGHNRVPSLLDLLANTCGTYWGVWLGHARAPLSNMLFTKLVIPLFQLLGFKEVMSRIMDRGA